MLTNPHSDRLLELDGLRGLAIIAVMLFHIIRLANSLTQNQLLLSLTDVVGLGWAGVDLFFVLSGFLITSILLRTKDQPGYFRNFYARRILRIFPLYYLVTGLVLILLPRLDPLGSAPATQAAWPFFMFYLQNWAYIPLPKLSFLLSATWSLAIEEQFYILWPAVVHFLDRRKVIFLSLGILAFSLAARLALVAFAGDWPLLQRFIYFSSFTHLDGLSVGALIAAAFLSEQLKRKFARFALPLLGLALVFLTLILLSNPDLEPTGQNFLLITLGYTLLALGSGALLVMLTTRPETGLLRKAFRNRVLAFFGKYSYSMYLIHLPIACVLWFNFMDARRSSGAAWLTFVGLSFGLTILGALLTWYLLESRALGLKKYFEYRPNQT